MINMDRFAMFLFSGYYEYKINEYKINKIKAYKMIYYPSIIQLTHSMDPKKIVVLYATFK